MADVGHQSGQIDDRESKIIRNLFRFKALTAEDIMTPRTVMVALQNETSIGDALIVHDSIPFSRLPLYGRDKDDILGFVLFEDILLAHLKGQDATPVSTLRRDLMSVLSTSKLTTLLDALMKRSQHIAVVTGEFGDTRGLVTLEDLIETLLGEEIMDEGDEVADMQQMARQLWEKRAKARGLLQASGEPVRLPDPGSGGKPAPPH